MKCVDTVFIDFKASAFCYYNIVVRGRNKKKMYYQLFVFNFVPGGGGGGSLD